MLLFSAVKFCTRNRVIEKGKKRENAALKVGQKWRQFGRILAILNKLCAIESPSLSLTII